MKLRIIDRREHPRPADHEFKRSIERRPFELQFFRNGRWTSLLACWYASREEAEQAKAKVARLLEEQA